MATTDEPLIVQRQGRVCTFVINRPDKLNSVTPEVMPRLADGLSALKGVDDVRAVVLRGASTGAFSAGFDIGRIGGLPQETGPPGNPLERGLEAIASYPYPVIAMVYGYALGGGCHLAAACDLCLAADTAVFGMTPAKLGLVYPIAGSPVHEGREAHHQPPGSGPADGGGGAGAPHVDGPRLRQRRRKGSPRRVQGEAQAPVQGAVGRRCRGRTRPCPRAAARAAPTIRRDNNGSVGRGQQTPTSIRARV